MCVEVSDRLKPPTTNMCTCDHNADTYHNMQCYGTLHFVTYQLPHENFGCKRLTFSLHNQESLFLDGAMSCNSAWPYMFRLTTIQAFVATQHSVVTKLVICTPVRKCLDPPLIDMVDNIEQSDIRLYADDTLLCVNLSKHPNILQAEVDKLYDWSKTWGMQFNAKKCVHVQIGENLPDTTTVLGNNRIPCVSSFKYLGVQIDSSLKWKTHVTTIVAKANRTLGMVKRGLRAMPI